MATTAINDASLTSASQSTDPVQCRAGVLFIRARSDMQGKLFLDANPAGASVNYVDAVFTKDDLRNVDDANYRCAVEPFDAGRVCNVKLRTSDDFAGSVTVSIVPDKQAREVG